MPRVQDVVEIRGIIKRETAKAILLEVKDPKQAEDLPPKAFWFPLSQITEIHRTSFEKNYDSLVVTRWILERKLEEIHGKNKSESTERKGYNADEENDDECPF